MTVPADASPRAFAEASLSPNTIRAYQSDLRQFARWRAGFLDHEVFEPSELEQIRTAPVDPAEVAAFLADKANAILPDGRQRYAPATISRYVAAIDWEHGRRGHTPRHHAHRPRRPQGHPTHPVRAGPAGEADDVEDAADDPA
ncbi:site-specific integrase [Curtobacterium sp. 24E2]|nr:site-specific integrase [Curtobacterium sp. 24E2]